MPSRASLDPAERSVTWLALRERAYVPVDRSGWIALGRDELDRLVEWPAVAGE